MDKIDKHLVKLTKEKEDHAYAHAHTHSQAHAQAHMHTHSHAHMHTHTHTSVMKERWHISIRPHKQQKENKGVLWKSLTNLTIRMKWRNFWKTLKTHEEQIVWTVLYI
jgi:hypothetical protein